MRKILLIILIVALLVASGFIIAKGFNIGDFTILGVKSLIERNDTIDDKNSELSTLVGVKYQNALSSLDKSAETLTSTKEDYENKATLISDSNRYMQTEKYEIEFLWTRLGNYAKDENVEIKIDVTNSATAGLYDLKFAIAGKYVDVTDFIYDVENDSKLGFKIEDFHMSAVEGGVQGTFACKEININIESAEEQQIEDENVEEIEEKERTTVDNTKENNTVTE